jgi:hypothetical protein
MLLLLAKTNDLLMNRIAAIYQMSAMHNVLCSIPAVALLF